MVQENWKWVPGYEDLYLVSDQGQVKSLDRLVRRRRGIFWLQPGRILKPEMTQNGYLMVTLVRNYQLKKFKVHRLVAAAWIPNLEDKPQVNHKNGIKTDNTASNLEWVTCRENHAHSVRTGLSARGSRQWNAVINEEIASDILANHANGLDAKSIALRYGISKDIVTSVIQRKNWKHVQ